MLQYALTYYLHKSKPLLAGNGLADDEITDELGVVISSQNAAREIIGSFPDPQTIPKPPKKKPIPKKK